MASNKHRILAPDKGPGCVYFKDGADGKHYVLEDGNAAFVGAGVTVDVATTLTVVEAAVATRSAGEYYDGIQAEVCPHTVVGDVVRFTRSATNPTAGLTFNYVLVGY